MSRFTEGDRKKMNEMKRFVVVQVGMGWEVEVDGQVWRFPSWEMVMEWCSENHVPCVVVRG